MDRPDADLSRVVDQHMKRAIAGVDLFEQAVHLFAIAHIAGNREYLRVHGLQLLLCPAEFLFVAGANGEPHTLAREFLRDRQSQATRSAGYQGNLSAQADLTKTFPCGTGEQYSSHPGDRAGGNGSSSSRYKNISNSHIVSSGETPLRIFAG